MAVKNDSTLTVNPDSYNSFIHVFFVDSVLKIENFGSFLELVYKFSEMWSGDFGPSFVGFNIDVQVLPLFLNHFGCSVGFERVGVHYSFTIL